MSEWSKEHDWKSCDVKASAGSNPVLCASAGNPPALIKTTSVWFFLFWARCPRLRKIFEFCLKHQI